LEALGEPLPLGLGPDGAPVGAADVELLPRAVAGGGVDGAVEDDVVQAVERAHHVEQQLGAVAALHGHHGVAALGPALHGHGRGRGRVRRRAVVVVRGHELVEAAVDVRDRGGGHGCHGARCLAVTADEVAEAREDARHPVGVALPAEEGAARQAAAVRPRAGVHHAALQVGQHGEHLGQEPRAVGPRELERRQTLERRRPGRLVPGPERLQTSMKPRQRKAALCSEREARGNEGDGER
jgi:hypothetical protein